MVLKKLLSLAMVGVMAFSLTACGNKADGGETAKNKKIVVWTLAEDLVKFADKYKEKYPDREVEVVVIPPADYVTKVTTALKAKSDVPDIIVGEPQMLPNLYEAGFFEDLSTGKYDMSQYKDKIVDYIYDIGKDSEGKLRALSYQVTPGGITYRRDIAQKVWGNDDPKFIAEKFKDVNTIIQTGKELKEKGYMVFADTGSLRFYTTGSHAEPWVKDNKLVMNQAKLDYMDAATKLYQEKLVAFAPEWSPAWAASMNGPIPVDAQWAKLEEVTNNPKTEVFAYSLPTWGTFILNGNAKDTAGKFGITTGPNPYFWGGTFVGMSAFSKAKDSAFEFLKFCTVDDEVAQWWVDSSNGDVVSNKTVLEANKDKENAFFGGQKTYAFWLEQAGKVDYSLVTKYDDNVNKYFGEAITAVQEGKMSKEEALKQFYTNVKTVYPEIEVPKQ